MLMKYILSFIVVVSCASNKSQLLEESKKIKDQIQAISGRVVAREYVIKDSVLKTLDGKAGTTISLINQAQELAVSVDKLKGLGYYLLLQKDSLQKKYDSLELEIKNY